MESQIGEAENMLSTTEANNFENILLVLQNLININDKDDENTEILTGHKQSNLDRNSSSEDSDNCSFSNQVIEIDNKNFECKTCDANFKSRVLYLQHCNEAHANGTVCFECEEQCVHEEYLKDIKKQISEGTKLLRCPECDFTCLNKQSLVAHMNQVHLNFFPYLCDICGETFHSLIAHQHHTALYHEEMLKCEYCELKCNSISDKTKHMAECKFQSRKYQCYECKACFSIKNKLIIHIETVHGHDNTRSYHNRLQTFPIKSRKHIYKIHRGGHTDINKARHCSICPAVLYSLSGLKKHLNSHEPGEKHKCHTCNKEFSTRKLYNMHISSYTHLKKADPESKTKFNFACPLCDFTCKTNLMMENHKNTDHFKVKPHICTMCKKAFTTSTKLRYHMERHRGIRQFQCSECSSMFTAASGLKKHCLRYHSEQRPVACDMCDKSFVCQSECNLHKLRHHSEKNVPCPLCDGKFHSHSNLRSHIRKVHMKGMDLDEFMVNSGGASEHLYELLRDHRLLF